MRERGVDGEERAALGGPTGSPAMRAFTGTTDAVGFSWFVTVRWASIGAMLGAVGVGQSALGHTPPVLPTIVLPAGAAAANLAFEWMRRRNTALPIAPAALAVIFDIAALSWLLLQTGGPLNPVSIFLVVPIVLSALVLGRTWTWMVTLAAVAGYGALFLPPAPDLNAARMMHPMIDRHILGMWWAFVATAVLVAALVTHLAMLVARRDQALVALRAEADRSARLASLATLAAGAAHELATPLGTIAVTVRELERRMLEARVHPDWLDDVRLMREELSRCRGILDDMGASAGQPAGEVPGETVLSAAIDRVKDLLPAADRDRVDVRIANDEMVFWPIEAVARALANLVSNAVHASPPGEQATVTCAREGDDVSIVIRDRGRGIPPEHAARVGEPFFTTRGPGEGLGLGVFVARAVVTQLGGTFKLDSVEQVGTTATVVLPLRVVPV